MADIFWEIFISRHIISQINQVLIRALNPFINNTERFAKGLRV